mgnify:CR=1 FL=1
MGKVLRQGQQIGVPLGRYEPGDASSGPIQHVLAPDNYKITGLLVYRLGAIWGADHYVFDPRAVNTFDVETWLDTENHIVLDHGLIIFTQIRFLVRLQSDPMPGSVNEILPETMFRQFVASRCINIVTHRAMGYGVRGEFLCHLQDRIALSELLPRVAHRVSPSAVAAVATGHRATYIDYYRLPRLDDSVTEFMVGTRPVGAGGNNHEINM